MLSSSKLKLIKKECEEAETLIDDFLRKTDVRPRRAAGEDGGRGGILQVPTSSTKPPPQATEHERGRRAI